MTTIYFTTSEPLPQNHSPSNSKHTSWYFLVAGEANAYSLSSRNPDHHERWILQRWIRGWAQKCTKTRKVPTASSLCTHLCKHARSAPLLLHRLRRGVSRGVARRRSLAPSYNSDDIFIINSAIYVYHIMYITYVSVMMIMIMILALLDILQYRSSSL